MKVNTVAAVGGRRGGGLSAPRHASPEHGGGGAVYGNSTADARVIDIHALIGVLGHELLAGDEEDVIPARRRGEEA